MDIAERNGSARRRSLRSADRFSDRAISRGLGQVKTPGSRSSALLVRVTSLDQSIRSSAILQFHLGYRLAGRRGGDRLERQLEFSVPIHEEESRYLSEVELQLIFGTGYWISVQSGRA